MLPVEICRRDIHFHLNQNLRFWWIKQSEIFEKQSERLSLEGIKT